MKIHYTIIAAIAVLLVGCKVEQPIPTLSYEYREETSVRENKSTQTETKTIYRNKDKILEIELIRSRKDDGWDEPCVIRQKVFWDGQDVFEIMTTSFSGSQTFGTKSSIGSNVEVHTSLNKDGNIEDICLSTESLELLRSFKVVKNMLYPIPSAEVDRHNEIMGAVSQTFGDFHDEKITGDEFLEQAVEIHKKYNLE